MRDYLEKKSILMVDDDPNNLRLLQEVLQDEYKIHAATSAERALNFLEKAIPNLILLDIEMPGMSGYAMIQRLKSDYRWLDIPVIFLTGIEGRESEQKAFELGAVDYVLKPISANVVRSRVSLHIELQAHRLELEDMVYKKTEQLSKTQDSILEMLANVTAIRDNETGAHIKRTTGYVELLVNNLIKVKHEDYVIRSEFAENLIKSAKLHDIGKVAIPDSTLLKPSKLTDFEFDLIKKHTVFGAHILDQAINELGDDSYFLYVARQLIISHHEKWNGKGYPFGLAGAEIPLAGRIMAVADVYDALVSERPYKAPLSHDEAFNIILKDAGTHFDPVLLELSEPIFPGFAEIAKTYKDENYRFKMLQADEDED